MGYTINERLNSLLNFYQNLIYQIKNQSIQLVPLLIMFGHKESKASINFTMKYLSVYKHNGIQFKALLYQLHLLSQLQLDKSLFLQDRHLTI